MAKKIILLVLITLSLSASEPLTLDQVNEQYATALQNLINAYEPASLNVSILDSSHIIGATYRKILQPYILYLTNYANIVMQEFALKISYEKDLETLTNEFTIYQKKVEKLIDVFPQALQASALNIFYEALSSIVQTSSQIITTLAYQAVGNDQDLVNGKLAYNLAWQAQSTTMKLSNYQTVAEFKEGLTENIVNLIKAGIAKTTQKISYVIGNEKNNQNLYEQIASDHDFLSIVYTNYGGQLGLQNAQLQSQAAAQIRVHAKQNEQAYQILENAEKQVQDSVSKTLSLIPSNADQLKSWLNESLQDMQTAENQYTKAEQAYTQAGNSVGSLYCKGKSSLIQSYMHIRGVQVLWNLFFQNMSASTNQTGVNAFSDLQSFCNSNNPTAIQLKNFQKVLINLQNLCLKSPNAFNQTLAMFPLVKQAIVLYQSESSSTSNRINSDSFIDSQILFALQDSLKLISIICQQIIASMQPKQQNISWAQTMSQAVLAAQQLDSLFEKNPNLKQFIFYFPEMLSATNDQQSFVFFVVQLLQKMATVKINNLQNSEPLKALYWATSLVQFQKELIPEQWSNLEQIITRLTTQAKPILSDLTILNTLKNMNWTQVKPVAVSSKKQSVVSSTKITSLEQTASLQLTKNDFTQATISYNQLQNTLSSLIENNNTGADLSNLQTEYFLAKTRFTACSLASSVTSLGSGVFGGLPNVPTSYFATQFSTGSIDLQTFGTSLLPASLQSLSSKTMQILNSAQQVEALAIFKAYVINEMLSNQSVQFSDVYTNYLLSVNPNAQAAEQKIAASVENQVNFYLKDFTNVEISAMVTGQTEISMIIKNMPIPMITPLYPGAPYAAVYYVGAATLFAPGTSLISIGGSAVSYVPGQSQSAMEAMYNDLAYVYVANAQVMMNNAQALISNLIKNIEQKTFMNDYQQVTQNIVRAQALLFAQNTSAYAYFLKAGQQSLANQVKAVYLSLYQIQIAFIQKCLANIKNPFSENYNALLKDCNVAYLSWSSELDQTTQTAQISQINNDIINLFVTAGTSCLGYQYEQSIYPGVKQVHYFTAAADFTAAKLKYASMNVTNQVSEMETKIVNAFFEGCVQNIELFFFVQNHGITLDKTVVTFEQLLTQSAQQSSGVSMNQTQTSAYNSVKNLLLDASMFFQYLSGYYQKLAGTQTSIQTGSVQNQILAYLKSKNAISSSATQILYNSVGVKESILALAQEGYQNFITSNALLAAWINVLNVAVAYVYIDNYLGGNKKGVQISQNSTEFEQFFGAVQNASAQLQNPSSAYVG